MQTHLDLCSGIGGFALAASWAGYRTVGFCEPDPFCVRVLGKNFPGVPVHDDVRTLSAEVVRSWVGAARDEAVQYADGRGRDEGRRSGVVGSVGERGEDTVPSSAPTDAGSRLELLTAGYPCQPFSHAGRRLGQADDRHLWPAIAGLLGALRPRWALLENVAGHVSLGLDDVLADLEALGYAWGAAVVPACAVNAPHRRDRVWIVAHAGEGDGGRVADPSAGHVGDGQATGRQEGAGWFGERGQDVADAEDGGPRCRTASWPGRQPALGGEADDEGRIADDAVRGRHGREDRSLRPGRDGALGAGGREVVGRLGREVDGLSPWLDRPERAWGDGWESGIPRTVAGRQADRVSRLKALGNAIVPQVAYEFIRAMDAA